LIISVKKICESIALLKVTCSECETYHVHHARLDKENCQILFKIQLKYVVYFPKNN